MEQQNGKKKVKILQDRLNHLKSNLATYEHPKLDKDMSQYEDVILETEIRIAEVEHIRQLIKNKTY